MVVQVRNIQILKSFRGRITLWLFSIAMEHYLRMIYDDLPKEKLVIVHGYVKLLGGG